MPGGAPWGGTPPGFRLSRLRTAARVSAIAFRRLGLGLALGVVVAWLLVSATPARADFVDGLAAYDSGDYQTALEEWRALAEAGHAEAQVALAGLYMAGEGVAADSAAAIQWYRRAAETGHPVAQLNLGEFYRLGRAVARDPLAAYVWFALAAEQGRAWAGRQRDALAGELTASQLREAEARIEARRRP